jgi:predicted dehydrogenase
MSKNRLHRRRFLHVAAAGLAASPFSILESAAAQKNYRTAIIGTGWWGMNILGEAMASGECKVVGMCDVDQRFLDPAAELVQKTTGDRPKKYRDYRELLESEKPEIVIVATPDHWHPLQTIAAVRAGAHVYVEKPIGHTIQEGRAMVNAAREAQRVVQVGTHRRISPHNVSGYEFIRSGKVGKIGMVRAFVNYGGGREQPMANSEPPKELDWDMWCGPAPRRHYCSHFPSRWGRGIHPRGFRHYLDYANGTIGDWGIHWMDQIVWILEEKWPRKIFSTGGRNIAGPPVYNEKEQTSDSPDHQVATFEFENFTAVWENRRFGANNAEKGEDVGCYFYGTEGIFHMGWQDGWVFYPANSKSAPVREKAKLHEPDGQNIKEHWADFLQAIKTGRKPVSDIEEAHYATNMSLLGMLSYKLGRGLEWDGAREKVVNDPEANKGLRREYRGEWEYPEVR